MSGPETVAAPTDSFEGYAVPPGRYVARRVRGPRYFATLGLWVLLLVAGMMILALVDGRIDDAATRYACPPDCGRPPIGLPVATNPRFTAADGSFSVSYPVPGAAYDVTIEPDGVIADWTGGDGGTMRLFSRPANGRDAKQVAEELLQTGFPDAATAYELPNATVGFHLGYGEVADFQPVGAASVTGRLRVIIIVAIKDDLALVAAAHGPFREFTPSFGPGPPSPANLQIAQDMGKYVNSFRWRGDSLR
jgi:hypothetical protein